MGDGCLCSVLTPAAGLAAGGAKKRRVELEQQRQRSSLLDDAASSSLISFSKACYIPDPYSLPSGFNPPLSFNEDILEFSCGFKRNLQLEKQMDYLQSSVPVKPTRSRTRRRQRNAEDPLRQAPTPQRPQWWRRRRPRGIITGG
ncbi:hypothetical protein OPV22_019988 [Ensete ventricosum]|uniref:Uncharacterized protein n=1 Tax=Ensete ventricosum TaxID=4639 RepID=A0AAV8QD42_ENSVE|nr:hypothetical protein OPV22_019988 [Ensete ventricosum]